MPKSGGNPQGACREGCVHPILEDLYSRPFADGADVCSVLRFSRVRGVPNSNRVEQPPDRPIFGIFGIPGTFGIPGIFGTVGIFGIYGIFGISEC